MVRLVDIAARVGVSVMTVSKALRDQPDVAVKTRQLIKATAQAMGYVPDSSAQSLRTRATKLFGVVIPSSTNPVFFRLIYALEERARESGYDILLCHTHDKTAREELCIRRLLARRVDGLFVAPVYRMESTGKIYEELSASKTPTILLGSPAAFCQQFPCVQTDELPASQAVTRHLLELGHRRIAYFTGPLPALWAQERYEGFRRAHREAGLVVDDALIFHAGSTIEDGAKAALQLANEQCQATAIQAANDLVAIGCIETLQQQGLRVPQDLSVAGFGNGLLAKHFCVPLTTARQPKYRMGIVAVEMMLQLLQGKPVSNRRLPAELVLRASTAAPPPPAK
ncbi:MAG TPA: LacI family DNA-binding transcriptional regulator [Verrucomicrobiota bacterium]|nr:LacI family DNA-binding transcriptional regulator [Verrucomicrobiota bacterium]HNT14695.1 LacI family DNA-binding transcriptional regulator [Verrucomicrobiota bacterium]